MWTIGKSYLFMTTGGFFHVGRVTHLSPTHIRIEEASRIYDLGIASTAHKTGKFSRSDYIGERVICLLGTDSEPWNHPLPKLIET